MSAVDPFRPVILDRGRTGTIERIPVGFDQVVDGILAHQSLRRAVLEQCAKRHIEEYRAVGNDLVSRLSGYIDGTLRPWAQGKDEESGGDSGGARLTNRQREVLTLAARGMANRDICAMLYCDKRNVDWHMSNIIQRLGCRNRVQAINRARELGLID